MARRLRLMLAGMGVACVMTSCASVTQVDELGNQISAVEAEVRGLRTQRAELLGRIEELAADLAAVVAGLPAVLDDSALKGEIEEVRRTAAEALELASIAVDATDSLTFCINDYMDTIASWSSNVASSYTYFYC